MRARATAFRTEPRPCSSGLPTAPAPLLWAVVGILLLASSGCLSTARPSDEMGGEDGASNPTHAHASHSEEGDGSAEAQESERLAQTRETRAEEREEAAERVQPPRELPRSEFFARVRAKLPERFALLHNPDGTPISVFHDLDSNGYEDGFFLLLDRREAARLLGRGENDAAAERGEAEGTAEQHSDAEAGGGEPGGEAHQTAVPYADLQLTTAMVGDVSTLLAERKPAVGYYLAVFLQRADEVVSMYRLPLGSWKVFDSFGSLRIDPSRNLPLSISAAFQTQEGTEHHWVIFYRYDKFSIFTFSDTISTRYEVRDLDRDGVLDLLEWHKVFEEGTGYETYITWYRWTGRSYSRHETTNVVRNLNSFLGRIAELLEENHWGLLLRTTLRPEDRRALEEIDDTGALFARLFRDESAPQPTEALQKVIFPKIFENPFHSHNTDAAEAGKPRRAAGFDTVRFSARFIYRDGSSQVRKCKIGMSENPFSGQEFFLVPE